MAIQPSVIKTLLERVSKRNFEQYIIQIRLDRIRSFKEQRVDFDFPVTAIIGTNGGGKSTILGAAALAYKSIRPRDFFPKSNVSDTSMADWQINYDILDRTNDSRAAIDARFVDKRWRRNAPAEREVVYFPIQRTVPAGETGKYRKFIGSNQIHGLNIERLPDQVIKSAGRILGKDISNYRKVYIKGDDSNYLLVGEHKSADYSQFHFGAGEASIIDIVLQIEESKKSSLILIEEIENGLHPLAITMLVEYLVDSADRKRLQIIYTTHSSYALSGLPSEAVWACVDGEVRQGVLSIESLRALGGEVESKVVAFAEDQFAKEWIENALRQYGGEEFHSIEVHAAGGYPFNYRMAKSHNSNPSINSHAVAIVDGDQDTSSLDSIAIRLPGGVPETEIFQWVSDNIETLSAKLKQRCCVDHLSQDQIIDIVRLCGVKNSDPHKIFSELSEEFGFISEIVIRTAFFSLYNSGNKETMEKIIQRITRCVHGDA